MTYPEQLETQDWTARRNAILQRDNHTCQFCGRKQSINILHEGKQFYIGRDESCRVTHDKLDYSSSEEQDASFRKYVYEIDDINRQVAIFNHEGYYLAVSRRGRLIYFLENNLSDILNNLENKRYRIIRAHVKDDMYIHIYYHNPNHLRELDLPAYYVSENMVVLNVHHKYYEAGKNAWEYADNALITLCDECHHKIHKCSDVKVYAKVDGKYITMNYTPCTRCHGMGYFPEYKKIQGGICFRCRGLRYEELIR
jgi:hypothetical protein